MNSNPNKKMPEVTKKTIILLQGVVPIGVSLLNIEL